MKKVVSAAQAAPLVFDLFKQKPWLNPKEVMSPDDAPAEDEAIHFLLTLETADSWGSISPAAKRVAGSLLLDFLARLMHPGSPNASDTWEVPADWPAWRQATAVVASEIRRSFPHVAMRH